MNIVGKRPLSPAQVGNDGRDSHHYTITVTKRPRLAIPARMAPVFPDNQHVSPSSLLDGLAFAATLQDEKCGLDVLLSGIESLECLVPQQPHLVVLPPISTLLKQVAAAAPFSETVAQVSPSSPSSQGQTAPDSLSESANDSNEDTVPSSPTNSCDTLPFDSISLTMAKYLKASSETLITIRTACVAQKSYGLEKRFLCPPPALHVSGLNTMSKQLVRVSLVNEDGSRGISQQAVLDDQGRGLFKYLHVADSFKSKLFVLRFRVHAHDDTILQSFDAKPITIISKPSKKTSKSGNHAMAVHSGAMVCFFNRVNSQTVRTKYMTVDQKRLCAKNSAWSTFEILALNPNGSIDCTHSIITYGSQVLLRNVETGVYSDVLIIKKVAKDVIIDEATGPVSQMQKIALVNAAAPSTCLSIVPVTCYGTNTPFLCYQSLVDGKDLDNHMSWTIVGIEKTQYRLAAPTLIPSMIEKPQIQLVRVHAGGVDIVGQRMHRVQAVIFGLPKGQQHRVPVAPMPTVVNVMPPTFEANSEFASIATSTSLVSSISMDIILELANGLLFHTGRFLVYERIGQHHTTARVVDP